MAQPIIIGLASIVVLGIVAQWIAWRLRIPSILLLLAFGLLAGPATGFLKPDELLGPLLLPLVSLSVAVILFEGGLSLRIRELRDIGRILFHLTTVGLAATWVISTLAAWLLLDFPWPMAVLLGAILVVTGPTVIGPLLKHVRLGGRLGSLLRWEGIVIDPIGAMLAVLVFDAVLTGETPQATTGAAVHFFKVAATGAALGLLGAGFLYLLLRRYWIPDALHNPVSLTAVVAVFTASNLVQSDSGLLAVTVMGIALANQKGVNVKHIITFKESVSILLIASLFIVLGARLQRGDLAALGLNSVLFLAVLILLARPASVLLSTLGSRLQWRERLFLSLMAPRGIVAAAVSSVFALKLAQAGYAPAGRLVPVTFLVIIGTVIIYGLGAAPLARRLRLAEPNPQGVLFVGAHPWARELAAALQATGCPVLLADSNWTNVSAARMAGLSAYYGSVLSEHALEDIDLGEIGRMLALTSNDEVNALACLRFAETFGRREVYQLPFKTGKEGRREAVSPEHRGRFLFGPDTTYLHLDERFGDQPTVKTTPLTMAFDYQAFQALHGNRAVPAFLVKENGAVEVFTAEEMPAPQPGQLLISLVDAVPEPTDPEAHLVRAG